MDHDWTRTLWEWWRLDVEDDEDENYDYDDGDDDDDDDGDSDDDGEDDGDITQGLLFYIDIMEKVENAARILRGPMIRPAKEMIVENPSRLLPFGHEELPEGVVHISHYRQWCTFFQAGVPKMTIMRYAWWCSPCLS